LRPRTPSYRFACCSCDRLHVEGSLRLASSMGYIRPVSLPSCPPNSMLSNLYELGEVASVAIGAGQRLCEVAYYETHSSSKGSDNHGCNRRCHRPPKAPIPRPIACCTPMPYPMLLGELTELRSYHRLARSRNPELLILLFDVVFSSCRRQMSRRRPGRHQRSLRRSLQSCRRRNAAACRCGERELFRFHPRMVHSCGR
jgi:hypothetical protein